MVITDNDKHTKLIASPCAKRASVTSSMMIAFWAYVDAGAQRYWKGNQYAYRDTRWHSICCPEGWEPVRNDFGAESARFSTSPQTHDCGPILRPSQYHSPSRRFSLLSACNPIAPTFLVPNVSATAEDEQAGRNNPGTEGPECTHFLPATLKLSPFRRHGTFPKQHLVSRWHGQSSLASQPANRPAGRRRLPLAHSLPISCGTERRQRQTKPPGVRSRMARRPAISGRADAPQA